MGRGLAWMAIGALLANASCVTAADEDSESAEGAAGHGVDLSTLAVDAPGRVVAIGDLHGDLAAARMALRLAGAIAENDTSERPRWIGGNLVVVQTGDLLDRGPSDRQLIELFDHLATEARAAGGAVIALNGNHEVLNVAGDFEDATARGLASFDGAQGVDPAARGERARTLALRPGGPYARRLASRNIAVVIGDTLFLHGGVTPDSLSTLVRLNDDLKAWMNGTRRTMPRIALEDGPTSPLWSRRYSERPSTGQCEALRAALGRARGRIGPITRMVVGHTVQYEGINAACSGTVWRIDVGLGAAYDREHTEHGFPGGHDQVLEIAGGQVRVLTRR